MSAPRSRLRGLPISVQILGLLLGGLVIAQIATLSLTLLLPPAPAPQHSLAEIAGALRGGPLGQGDRPLVRDADTLPPSLQSPGWMAQPQSTRELARLLDAPETDVRLLFYAPPPFAGASPALRMARMGQGGPNLPLEVTRVAFDQGGGGGPGGPGGGPMGAGGPAGFPGAQSGVLGPSGFPGRSPSSGGFPPSGAGRRPPADTAGGGSARSSGPAAFPRANGPGSADGPPAGSGGPGIQRAQAPTPAAQPPRAPAIRTPLDAAVFASQPRPVAAQPPVVSVPLTRVEPAPTESGPLVAAGRPPIRQQDLTVAPAPSLSIQKGAPADGAAFGPARTLAPPVAPGLFGRGSTPQVEGEFVAALRVSPGRWVTVRPEPEGFPNSWQRRLLLWFAVAFAGVAPLGYLFARRLAAPLTDFAAAAEALGRDPQAAVAATEGPAEVGRAARAFNQMQARLKRYVEDRTAMIGAISHDLRTPLARMRFRLERAPPALKAAMSRDIAQMEEMITSVLTFMRDDAAAGRRDRVDLRSVLECVVDDACASGGAAELEPGGVVEAEVNLLAMQRVFENLVGNAVKYGERATVRLSVQAGEAVVEVADAGPGLPDAELEQVFQPFYRGAEARNSTKGGVGLGLAVSRSTVRAHGGDLVLRRAQPGLVAQVRLPVARAGRLAA